MAPPYIYVSKNDVQKINVYGGQGGSVPFTPSSLSGLIQWNSSDTGVTTAGTPIRLTSWADHSGAGTSLVPETVGPQFFATDPQYNNLPSFSAASGQILSSSANISYGPFTIFVVGKTTTSGYVYTHNVLKDYLWGNITNTISVAVRGGAGNSGYNLVSAWSKSLTPRIYTRRFDGTHAGDILRINGSQQTMATTVASNPGTTPVADKFFLYGDAAGSGTSVGTYAELIVYNRALSDTEVLQVEQYCHDKFVFFNNRSCWLRADLGVALNGSTVAAWADQSTAGASPIFTNATGSSQPVFNVSGIGGNPELVFNGGQFLSGSQTIIGQQGITLFGIFSTTSSAQQALFGMRNAANHYMSFINPSITNPGVFGFIDGLGTTLTSSARVDDGNPHFFIVTNDAINSKVSNLYIDSGGSPVSTTTAASQTAIGNAANDFNSVGVQMNAANATITPFRGHIGEVGAFDYALPASDIATLATYLKGRAGI